CPPAPLPSSSSSTPRRPRPAAGAPPSAATSHERPRHDNRGSAGAPSGQTERSDMNGEILAASLAAAQHSTPARAMMMVLAALVAIVLAVIGIARWQRKRAGAEQQWNPHDRPAQHPRSPEEK